MSRKQKFKGKTLFQKTVVDNIVRVYNDPTFNFNSDWYEDASKLAKSLGEIYNVDYLKVCGIIAALSPLKSWEENKVIATKFLYNGEVKHTEVMGNKAKAILTNSKIQEVEEILSILNGNKIQNFFLNIAFPNESKAVTIDRHALSICLNRSIIEAEGVGITTKQYNFFVNCYVEASQVIGARPSLVQSISWEKWRELKKLN